MHATVNTWQSDATSGVSDFAFRPCLRLCVSGQLACGLPGMLFSLHFPSRMRVGVTGTCFTLAWQGFYSLCVALHFIAPTDK